MATHDPFQLDLKRQAAALLRALHITDANSTPTSSPLASLPLSHLQPLADVAFSEKPTTSPEALVDVLADLLEVRPLTLRVAELFRPLLLVLLGRWIDRSRGGREEWIRRVLAATLLAEGVEQIWPCVSSSSPS